MNVNKLKGKIVECGMNVGELASAIGIDRASLYRKLHDMDKFTIGEASRIKEVLHICDSDAIEIFFSKKSHDTHITSYVNGFLSGQN